MRRAHSLLLAVAACLPLAGCYYDPDYGYVRNTSGADAYYGEETIVSPGGYGYGSAYGYDGYGPGCCYPGIGVGTVWYDSGYNRRYYDRGRDWHGHPPPRGDGHGRPGDNRPPGRWQGNNNRPPGGHGDNDNRPPGGWRGGGRPGGNDGDHRPPRGNWQGGNRPPGGWHGGSGGDHRPQSTAPRSAPTVRQAGTGRDRSRFRSGTD